MASDPMTADEAQPTADAQSSELSDSAPSGAALSDDERAQRLANLNELIALIADAVRADGGDLILQHANVESGRVEVQLQGSCSSCAISSTTLQGGVERILHERLPWVTEVVGSVDDEMDFETSAAMGQGGYVPKF